MMQMSFNQAKTGIGYAPGWFLADNEHCTRETRQIAANHAQVKTAANGGKYVPMGAIWPSNDANAVGIVYEDVDVTTGNMPGSVVTAGTVYLDRLPAAPSEDETSGGTTTAGAKSTLEKLGFKFITSAPAVTRPDD